MNTQNDHQSTVGESPEAGDQNQAGTTDVRELFNRRGMSRRDLILALAGGGIGLAAAAFGVKRLTADKLNEMSEEELQQAMTATLKFHKRENKLTFAKTLEDGRKVEKHNFSDKVAGCPFSTITLEDDDRFAAPVIDTNTIQDGQEVQFSRVITATTQVADFQDHNGTYNYSNKPLFEEIHIMGETIEPTREMISVDGDALQLEVKGMTFVCPIAWSELKANLDATKKQRVSFVFNGKVQGVEQPTTTEPDSSSKPKVEPKAERRVEPTVEPKVEQKPILEPDSSSKPKVKLKAERRVEPKSEPKSEQDKIEKNRTGVITLNSDNFNNEVLKSDKPVLVDFYATWCGPCKQMAPFLEAYAREYSGKIKFGKIDAELNPDIADMCNVDGYPHFALFQNGKIVGEVKGAYPVKIRRLLDSL